MDPVVDQVRNCYAFEKENTDLEKLCRSLGPSLAEVLLVFQRVTPAQRTSLVGRLVETVEEQVIASLSGNDEAVEVCKNIATGLMLCFDLEHSDLVEVNPSERADLDIPVGADTNLMNDEHRNGDNVDTEDFDDSFVEHHSRDGDVAMEETQDIEHPSDSNHTQPVRITSHHINRRRNFGNNRATSGKRSEAIESIKPSLRRLASVMLEDQSLESLTQLRSAEQASALLFDEVQSANVASLLQIINQLEDSTVDHVMHRRYFLMTLAHQFELVRELTPYTGGNRDVYNEARWDNLMALAWPALKRAKVLKQSSKQYLDERKRMKNRVQAGDNWLKLDQSLGQGAFALVPAGHGAVMRSSR